MGQWGTIPAVETNRAATAPWPGGEHPLKITRVRPWIVSGPPEEAGGRPERGGSLSYVFIQVETDEGLTGWGEITTYPGPVAHRTIAAAPRPADGAPGGGER